MKKIMLFALGIMLSIGAYAQMEINWGTRFYEIKDAVTDAKFIAEDNSGYYFYYCINEYQGEGEFEYKYYVAKTDLEGTVTKVAAIDFGSKKFKIEQTWRNGSLAGFILSKTSQDKPKDTGRSSRKKASTTVTGKQTLYTQYFHLNDMRLIDEPQKFLTYNYFADSAQAPYLFKFSENKSKMVFCLFTNDTASRAAEVRVFDTKMNQLWSQTYRLSSIKSPSYRVTDVSVNNDGDKVLLGINGYPTGKKIMHKDEVATLVYLTQYQQRQHDLNIPDAWPVSMQTCFNLEGDYMLAGYYGETNDNPTYAAGSFAYTFDARRNYQKNFSKVEFKEYETDAMVEKGMAKPSQFTTYVDHLVPMVGGNVVMVGEQRFASKVVPPKKRGEKPTGENAQFYRDLCITNIDRTGLITGNAYIAKRQKESKSLGNMYNSYCITRDRYGMYIMFNDHIDNYKDGQYTPKRNYDSDKLRTLINFVQVYSDGSFNWMQALKTKETKMPLYNTIWLTSTKNLLFLCHWEDNNAIGKIETR